MSGVKDITKALDELESSITGLIGSVKNLIDLISPKDAQEPEPQEQPKKKAPAKQKALTLEDVRKVCAEKSRAGFTAEIKELLIKHGGDKLSTVPEEEYPALIAEVEALADGN